VYDDYVEVYLNGIQLGNEDYELHDNNFIRLKQGAKDGDIIRVVGYESFKYDRYNKTYKNLNADANIYPNDVIFVDTSDNAVTLTLPSSARIGDEIIIKDDKNKFATNNCTVNRNGLTIEYAEDDLVLDVDGSTTTLVYNGNTWKIM